MQRSHQTVILAAAAGFALAGLAIVNGKRQHVSEAGPVRFETEESRAPEVHAEDAPSVVVDEQQTLSAAPAYASKYRLLLRQVRNIDTSSLLTLVEARERARSTAMMADDAALDLELSKVLGAEYTLFQQLLESEAEQALIQSIARELRATAPLTAEQEDALLAAKLRSKPALDELAAQLYLLPELEAMERGYLQDVTTAGFEHHAHVFLEEARAVLNEEQWVALAEVEGRNTQHRLTTLFE